jgi:hypothetical protein
MGHTDRAVSTQSLFFYSLEGITNMEHGFQKFHFGHVRCVSVTENLTSNEKQQLWGKFMTPTLTTPVITINF